MKDGYYWARERISGTQIVKWDVWEIVKIRNVHGDGWVESCGTEMMYPVGDFLVGERIPDHEVTE